MKASEGLARGLVFRIRGAQALTETPLQPHVVWLGSVSGDVYGIVTSVLGHVSDANARDVLWHAFVSAIQRCFLSEEFVSLMGAEAVDLDQVVEDLATVDFGEAVVEVQGVSVPCSQTVYHGVEFVCGHDPTRWPFTIARRSSLHGDWPALEQQPAA